MWRVYSETAVFAITFFDNIEISEYNGFVEVCKASNELVKESRMDCSGHSKVYDCFRTCGVVEGVRSNIKRLAISLNCFETPGVLGVHRGD